MASNFPVARRPLSPNMQLYRPQLTSVLSIVNRLTGILLSIAAIALVIWLIAGAAGPQVYAIVKAAIASGTGQVVAASDTLSGTPCTVSNSGPSTCRDEPLSPPAL